MQVIEFKYNGKEADRRLLVLDESKDDRYGGIDLSVISPPLAEEIEHVVAELNDLINDAVKGENGYRMFMKNKMQETKDAS